MKKSLFIGLLFFPLKVHALSLSIGPIAPISCTNNPLVGSTAWTNPSNAIANDLIYSTCAALLPTNYLSCTYPSFTGLVPPNAIITGLQVDVPRYNAAVTISIKDYFVDFILNGSTGTNLGFTGNNWETVRTTITYGGDGNLWGLTLAKGPTDINNLAFNFSFNPAGNNTGAVDVALLTVFYLPGTTFYNATIRNGTLR